MVRHIDLFSSLRSFFLPRQSFSIVRGRGSLTREVWAKSGINETTSIGKPMQLPKWPFLTPPLSTDLIPLPPLGSSSSHTLVWSFLESLRLTTSAYKLTALSELAASQGPTCDFFALSWYNYQIVPPTLFQSRGLQASSSKLSGPLLAGCHRDW